MRSRPTWPSRVLVRGLVTLVGLAVWTVATNGVWAAFTAPASIGSNSFSTGQVTISDDDAGSAMMSLSGMKPGDSDSACIQVTYNGSVPATVHLYGATTGTGLDQYLNLTVTRGSISSGSFDSCTNFTADVGGGVLYSGTLRDFPDAYGGAVADPRVTWAANDVHAYKFTVVLQDDNAAQGLNATQQFNWEARG